MKRDLVFILDIYNDVIFYIIVVYVYKFVIFENRIDWYE